MEMTCPKCRLRWTLTPISYLNGVARCNGCDTVLDSQNEPCPECGQDHPESTPCQPIERELPDPEDEDPTPSRRNTP